MSTSPAFERANRPPPLNMVAVEESRERGSLTSLPSLLSRATQLYDVLASGKTASMILPGEPMPNLRESPDDQGNRCSTPIIQG
jgi:hypothetical protein